MPNAEGISSSQITVLSSQLPTGEGVAVVAALRREVWPLVKSWQVVHRKYAGLDLRFFENGELVLVCGGIGAEHARRATEGIIEFYKPTVIISAGFAGALVPELAVGDLVIPRRVVDARDGSSQDTGRGEGVLLTYPEVATASQKAKLAVAYGARVVDMEGAAVARGAASHGIKFFAVKVVSDRLDFEMPSLSRFVDQAGQFQTTRFAAYSAIRPWLWKSVVQLGRNSSIASRVLSKALIHESIVGISASKRG